VHSVFDLARHELRDRPVDLLPVPSVPALPRALEGILPAEPRDAALESLRACRSDLASLQVRRSALENGRVDGDPVAFADRLRRDTAETSQRVAEQFEALAGWCQSVADVLQGDADRAAELHLEVGKRLQDELAALGFSNEFDPPWVEKRDGERPFWGRHHRIICEHPEFKAAVELGERAKPLAGPFHGAATACRRRAAEVRAEQREREAEFRRSLTAGV
jgi:hypothetical protein